MIVDRIIPHSDTPSWILFPGMPSDGNFCGPNPVFKSVHGSTNFFREGKQLHGEIRILSNMGNHVRTIQVQDPGWPLWERRVVATWDLRDASGKEVGNGSYSVSVAGETTFTVTVAS